MAERISGAQAEIEHHLTELRRAASAGGDATPLLQADAQREGLGRLQHRIAQAHGAGLVSIRAEVSAFVAAAQAVAQQVRTVAATAQSTEAALHMASAAAGRETRDLAHDFYDRKIFDPYLRFTSAEDEEAYRRRETERQHYIAEQLALGTPEGNLNATEVMIQQMKDAKAHGADASPDFQSKLDAAEGVVAPLRSAIAARAASADARQVATPTAATTSPSADPLDAIAPTLDDGSKKAMAQFRAAGIVVADVDRPAHGVGAQPSTGAPRTV